MISKLLEWKVFLINFRCIVNPFTGFLPSATLFPFSWIISLAHALITGSSLCERKLIDLLYELFGIPLILLSIVSIIGITYSVPCKLFHFLSSNLYGYCAWNGYTFLCYGILRHIISAFAIYLIHWSKIHRISTNCWSQPIYENPKYFGSIL